MIDLPLGIKARDLLKALPRLKAAIDRELESEKWRGDEGGSDETIQGIFQELALKAMQSGWPKIVKMVEDMAKAEAEPQPARLRRNTPYGDGPLSPVGHALAAAQAAVEQVAAERSMDEYAERAADRDAIMQTYARAMAEIEPDSWALVEEIRAATPTLGTLPGDQITMRVQDWRRRLDELRTKVAHADEERDASMRETFGAPCAGHVEIPEGVPADMGGGDGGSADEGGDQRRGPDDDEPASDVPPFEGQ